MPEIVEMAYLLFVDVELDGVSQIHAFRSAANFFATNGHRTQILTDGQEALDQIKRDPPDVLVSQVMVTRRDGYDLARALKECCREKRTAVILLVGVAADVGHSLHISEKMHSTVDMLLVKPYVSRLNPQDRAADAIRTTFNEQLVVTVGHLLCRLGSPLRIIESGAEGV